MLKDLIKLSKFKYGMVVMVLYWVGQYPSQGVFPKKTLSKSCDGYEVEGVLHPLFANAIFFQALLFAINLLWYEHLVLCAMESKEHLQCHLKLGTR
jgi:hypothetical protein